MAGGYANAHAVADQEHERFINPRQLREVLGVAREVEVFALDGVFVDRTGHEHVNLVRGEVGHSGFKAFERIAAGGAVGFAGFGLPFVVPHVNDVDFFGVRLIGG